MTRMTTHVRPVDLEMRVKTVSEHGRTRLLYTLHSPNGAVDFSHREILGPTLQGYPEEYQAHLLHKIERLGQRVDVDDSLLLQADIERKLASLGRDLWRELFPPELRHAYRNFRESVRSWMIISDEPWIPWELIKPYESGRTEEKIDDDFLACRFELTRWLAGNKTPAQDFVVRRLVALRTGQDLPQSREELRLLTALAQSSPKLHIAPSLDSASDLLGLLEDHDIDLIHFAGHGLHAAGRVDESGVPFPDGSTLRPVDLEGPLASRIARTRPLVFLNACWGGQQGWAWSHLGGWAARWVGVCGCGAFVAPLWPARDKAALAFAETFYDALLRGEALGKAALEARQRLRQERPGDPSALAYTVYGHPNAVLTIGEDAADAGSPAPAPPLVFRKPLRSQTGSTGRSWSPLRSRKAWTAVSLMAGLLLAFASWQFPALWKPTIQTSATPPQASPAPVPTPTPSTTPAHNKPIVTSAGGITFEIVAAKGTPKSTLIQALQKAAAPLAARGISGWTVHLEVTSPHITSFDQDGMPWKACRLVAICRARRQGTSLDLGSVPADSSQSDAATACDAAAEPLAEAVVYQLVNSVRKGTS
jgi:hypothetical protein